MISRPAGLAVVIYLLFSTPAAGLSEQSLELLHSIGLVLLIVAAITRIYCLLFSAGFKNKRLLMEGPFSVVRNPLYVSSYVGIIGIALLCADPILMVAMLVFTGIYYTITVSAEERNLREKFGEDYLEYCLSTSRWLPSISNYHAPATLEIYPAHVLRGILHAMAFFLAYFAIQLLDVTRDAGVLPLSF